VIVAIGFELFTAPHAARRELVVPATVVAEVGTACPPVIGTT
jgi:hypothetical protein